MADLPKKKQRDEFRQLRKDALINKQAEIVTFVHKRVRKQTQFTEEQRQFFHNVLGGCFMSNPKERISVEELIRLFQTKKLN